MSSEFLKLLGGSALLIFSVEEISSQIQYLFGPKLRKWVNAFAERKISAILVGVLLSFLLSSSGAATLMLVGLANSQLLSLVQVFAMTLGASVGSTFIVQLFAFRVSEYGLLILALGIFLSSLSKSDKMYHIGKALLFLGMMFFSMDLIIQSGVGLENNELFRYLLNYFQDRPIISFCMSAVLTALIHSSNATIALIMSLMLAKGGNLSLAIPWVLGANVGTTATAFFGSFKSGHLGKQAALGNFLCKVVGVALILPMLDIFEKGVLYFGGDIQRQIANAHTLLNVFIAVLFFPFIHWGVLLVKKLIPENKEEGPFHFKYLDTKSLETPELALAQAQREILRLSDIVEKMVEKCACLFRENDQKLLESLKSMDQVADYLNKGIKMYLTKLSQSEMSSEQVQREFELLLRTNDLENIGDIVDKNILELARKKIKKGYSFSKEGWQEVSTFHLKVLECLQLSTNYFNSKDPALTSKLYLVRQQIEDMMIDFSEQHVQRLHRGVKESLDTSSIHLDLLGYFQRISDLATSFIRMQNHKQEILLTEPEFHGAKNWNP